jgi:hypothetical protein
MIKLAAVLSLPLLLVGVMASSSCLVVDVKEGGPDGMHIVVPVPLFLAQIALSFVPEEHTRIPIDDREAMEYIPMAEALVAELEKIPDSELVRVEENDELVVVSKVGDVLEVEVYEGEREHVVVNMPISAVQEILASFDGETFEASEAVAALRGISRTDLVHVRDGDEEVKVWIW